MALGGGGDPGGARRVQLAHLLCLPHPRLLLDPQWPDGRLGPRQWFVQPETLKCMTKYLLVHASHFKTGVACILEWFQRRSLIFLIPPFSSFDRSDHSPALTAFTPSLRVS